MNRVDLIAHIERQMEESAQMGEPPSFAFENVTEAAQLLAILRREAPVSETALPVCKICGAQHGKIDDVEYDCPHHPSLPSAIAPITGEITGNRANTLKAKAILGVVEHYLRCGDYPHLDKGEFTVVAQALRAYAATISKQEAVGMVNPATGYGSATGANACMPSTPDFHDFAARHPEWCSGTMLVKMRAAFDAGRSSVSSTAAPYVSPLLALTPKMPSAHDHGNCELCDWQEHRIAELESILSATAPTTMPKFGGVTCGFILSEMRKANGEKKAIPTVTVHFAGEDWESRDAFAKMLFNAVDRTSE